MKAIRVRVVSRIRDRKKRNRYRKRITLLERLKESILEWFKHVKRMDEVLKKNTKER